MDEQKRAERQTTISRPLIQEKEWSIDMGRKMVLPVGATIQHLVVLTKNGQRVTEIKDLSVRFVPMIHPN